MAEQPLFMVWDGPADIVPAKRTAQQVADADGWIAGVQATDPPDNDEFAALRERVRIMQPGMSDQIRTSSLHVGPEGAGVVSVARIR